MVKDDTICAVATADGVGAVGVVRLSGATARRLLDQACPDLRRVVPRMMHHVRLRDGEETVVDQVLVCFMPGPRSYTGEDVVEVHGHGGTRNLHRILARFVELGARVAEPGEFTRRAFLNGRLDLAQAEAVAKIVEAQSERALQAAQLILDGGLGRQLTELRRGLVEVGALLEAAIDFVEDTVEDTEEEDLQETLEQRHLQLMSALSRLASTYRVGKRLDGVVVALVGPVNVGKSSLFNKLLEVDRAIVSSEPGTTRDYLEAEVDWDGLRVVLVDTAGQRPPEELSELELRGHEVVAPVIDGCDLLLHVVDLTVPRERQHWPCAPTVDGQLVVVAANKADIHHDPVRHGGAELPVVTTSAVTGQGLGELKQTILKLLVDNERGSDSALVRVVHERHFHALGRAREALKEGLQALRQGLPPEVVVEHSRQALACLGQITGEEFTDEVLHQIFSRFCIGK